MNECFVSGYIASEVQFSFTLKKSPISVAKFKLKLLNNSVVNVYSFDENADFCYRALKKNCYIFIEGQINTDHVIIIKHIYKT